MAFKAPLNNKAALSKALFKSSLPLLFGKKNHQNELLLKRGYVYTCMGTSTIRLRSINSSLYPLRYSRDKVFQALSRFSAMESWVGPGNEPGMCRIFAQQVTYIKVKAVYCLLIIGIE